jgi:small-conductance mechanosensitive channel
MLQTAIQHLQSEYGVTLASATDWAMSAAILVGAAIVALPLHGAALFVARRVVGERQTYLRTVLAATKGPTRLALLLVALAAALPTAPLSSETAGVVARILGLATICLMGWIAVTALHIAADLYLMRFRLDVDDNLLARKHITQVRVLERVIDVVIVLITIGFALMTFDAVRQFGVTLFASAGVAGIVAGLAARPVLTNFLAGVQLAVAQPIRIDDAVIAQAVGPAAHGRAAQLFYRKAVPELDTQHRGYYGYRVPVPRLCHAAGAAAGGIDAAAGE